ncbi:MAG: nucleotidyl transferase AbiEii/AbiGii toxin family protein [Terrimicrobiaceae bacterium]
MIQTHCFDRIWIDAKQAELRLRDPGLLEKCIHALQLLGLLADSGIPFVFKGGTSMVLLLERLRRLSIDIDIVSESPESVDLAFLRRLAQDSRFVLVDEDDRGDHRLPRRRHFKFFYNSVYSSIDNYVMLDVLQERNLYPVTRRIPIRAAFIETMREIEVSLPTVDALLADKLTAFAPNTVGVRLTAESNMQVIKQVVDVGDLFERAADLPLIRQTYAAMFEAENGYRGGAFTLNQALDDTIKTALHISEIRLRPQDPTTALIDAARKRLENHLIGPALDMDNLKIAAARAACIAALIRNPASPLTLDEIRYDPARVAELRQVQIGLSQRLNRLSQANPEAFFYWHKVDTLLNENSAG